MKSCCARNIHFSAKLDSLLLHIERQIYVHDVRTFNGLFYCFFIIFSKLETLRIDNPSDKFSKISFFQGVNCVVVAVDRNNSNCVSTTYESIVKTLCRNACAVIVFVKLICNQCDNHMCFFILIIFHNFLNVNILYHIIKKLPNKNLKFFNYAYFCCFLFKIVIAFSMPMSFCYFVYPSKKRRCIEI